MSRSSRAGGASTADPNLRVREAGDDDAQAVCEVFRAVYGEEYSYPAFFDVYRMKKMIFGDDTLVLVAEDTAAGRILGTAAVILEVGAYSDLVGEFGRLAVHPDARGRGLGKLLMEERLRRVEQRLQVGVVEARVAHPFAQKISCRYGFAPVGFLASKHRFGDHRESVALLAQYFGHALRLRRNHPRVIPEVYPMAMTSFRNVGMEPDAIVAEREPSYPGGEDYQIQELTDEGYSSLLRIERGRRQDREVFGPLRLHYGFFKLQAHRSSYLIARKGSHIAGALGYTYDEYEGNLRVFELIVLEEHAIPALLHRLEEECSILPHVRALEIDVSAYAPRMQRTLLERGFVPVAYIPALAFQRTERLDVVKMQRLLDPVEIPPAKLLPATQRVADLVLEAYRHKEAIPRLREVAHHCHLFTGLTEEQVERLAGVFNRREFAAGSALFQAGEESEEMYVLLSGAVEIRMPEQSEPVGTVSSGETVGEVAFLAEARHSARAVAASEPVESGVLSRRDFADLVRRRPDIGVVIYRNLAQGLGEKLKRADRILSRG